MAQRENYVKRYWIDVTKGKRGWVGTLRKRVGDLTFVWFRSSPKKSQGQARRACEKFQKGYDKHHGADYERASLGAQDGWRWDSADGRQTRLELARIAELEQAGVLEMTTALAQALAEAIENAPEVAL